MLFNKIDNKSEVIGKCKMMKQHKNKEKRHFKKTQFHKKISTNLKNGQTPQSNCSCNLNSFSKQGQKLNRSSNSNEWASLKTWSPAKKQSHTSEDCAAPFGNKSEGNPIPSLEGHPIRKARKKKVSKKAADGMSNWASLCSQLKIDPTRKRTKVHSATETASVSESPEPKKSKPDIWFDNVDKIFIEKKTDSLESSLGVGQKKDSSIVLAKPDSSSGAVSEKDASAGLVKPESYKGLTHCVAMDCEMVGVGPQGEDSILARVSLVNHYGMCLYDKFVLPTEKVTDYRTHVSGVTRENLSTGEDFAKVQKEVSDILKGRILVGHALHNDLKVLFLTHPHKMLRDTSKYKAFRQLFKGGIPSLKKLADKVLGVSVQEGQHSSVQDAQAAMRLYTMHRQRWEKELKHLWKTDKRNTKKERGKNKKTPTQ